VRRLALLAVVVLGPVALAADPEIFHGWSKDGSWFVYEVQGANELDELFFCVTSDEVKPSWPAALHELDREAVGGLSCVRYMDPNKAPWQWQAQLALPKQSKFFGAVSIVPELVFEGESPGFVLEAGDKHQVCYASGLRESSKVQKSWFHPTGRFVALIIDGAFRHCVVTVKAPPAKPSKKR
jgi:hypothetical protein